ncbi:hypothetical protein ABZP36_030445 [Zizania latifolia]
MDALAMAARRLLNAPHDPVIPASSSSSSSSRPPPPNPDPRQSFPTLLPVFILFVLLLCFLSIFLLRDLLHFFSLWLRRRRRRRGGFHDGEDSVQNPTTPSGAPRKPPGLDPAILASFPTVRFEASAAAPPECAVCLSNFAGGDAVRLLTVCRHAFHTACIDSWLGAHTTCPVCRSDLDAPAPPHQEHVVAVVDERDARTD